MNCNINSSGLYDVNAYNLIATNATVLSSLTVSGTTTLKNSISCISSLYVSGSTRLNNITTINSSLNVSGITSLNNITTINSSLNVSGITTLNNITTVNSSLNVSGTTILNNFTTINAPLYINTNQNTTLSALSISSTSTGVLVNIIQNLGWNDGVNYALNVTGYSMFGGIQINGQDSNNIYKRVGDLTISSPSLSSIILKTNYGAWEAMRLNTAGTSINTSLYVSGLTILNNITTCRSSLNVSGTSTLNDTFVNRIITYNNTFPSLTSVNNATTHSIISVFPGINGQQGALTADLYNIYLSSFAYGTFMSGPQPYITVNCTTLYNGSNTKLTLQAYGGATGTSQGAKIIMNGNNGSGGSMSFINDTTTTCIMTGSSVDINGNVSCSGALQTGNKATIKGTSEGDTATLYLATPFTSGSASKCALIAQGLNTYSRSKLHICLNNTADNSTTYTAGLGDICATFDNSGNVGIGNANPLSDGGYTNFLCVGDSSASGSEGEIVIGKNSGGSRHYKFGITSDFNWGIGDFGNSNTIGTWKTQIICSYLAPSNSILINNFGQVIMQYGYYLTSDERIKTNIKTIENALDKTLLLRGVEYNDIRIEPDKLHLGLIAQEVELIIPEIVGYDERTKIKNISYNSLIPVLIEAIKQQQRQINELKSILKNNNLK